MHEGVPAYLAQQLIAQYGEETAERIAAGYAASRAVTLRANPLKADVQTVRQALAERGIETEPVAWYSDAMIVKNAREDALTALDMPKEEENKQAEAEAASGVEE